jgi:hypothetical protein
MRHNRAVQREERAMKPESIRRFDLFFLASLALLVVGFFISFDASVAAIQAETAARGAQVGGSGLAIGLFVVVLAIELLLWFFVSRKGVSIAKWLLVVLLIIDLFGLPSLVSGALTAPKIVSLLRIALEAVAIAFLFKADARAWFGGASDEDPDPAA